jgi:glucose-1-phosphate thymidylyltransferase
VKAIVAAAGYATRLRPLTERISKSLLPVGGRPMLDWILDRIVEVEEIDAVHVVTNSRYASDFARWAERSPTTLPLVVHDDGTSSNDDRLGALGDLALVIDRADLVADDLLVVAGDNLFDYSLADYVAFWRARGPASAVAVHDVGSLELAREYGVVEVDGDDRVLGFVEKPPAPTSTLAATATYLYHRTHVRLLDEYLRAGNPADHLGAFVAWLRSRRPVYAYRFPGAWLDIGNRDQLLEADNRMRARVGLPERSEYALGS